MEDATEVRSTNHRSKEHVFMRWALGICGGLVAIAGSLVSVYAIWHHLTLQTKGETDAFCNVNETFNCDAVAASAFSEIFGVPLGAWGLGYFLATALCLGIALSRNRYAHGHALAYIALVAVGVLTSVGLAGISAVAIGAFCLSCIGVYVVTALQGVVLAVFWRQLKKPFEMFQLVQGGASATAVVLLIAASFFAIQPSISQAMASAEKTSGAKPSAAEGPALSAEEYPVFVERASLSKLGEDFRKGPDDAKVVITEFADLQCPPCRRMSEILSRLAHEFPKDVQIVFKNYPIDTKCNRGTSHPQACYLAVLGR